MAITPASIVHIISYITSSRCRLHTFKANGNSIGSKGVRRLVKAIEKGNHGLLNVEMYSNQLGSGESVNEGDVVEDVSEDKDTNETHLDEWQSHETMLQRVLWRNKLLVEATEREATDLLRYSRAMLLHGKKCESPTSTLRRPHGTNSKVSPFQNLPTEIQLSILSLLAPVLSPAQRIRIFAYASTMDTLPRLAPSLPSAGHGFHWGGIGGAPSQAERGRREWLAEMECEVYDPARD
jgi:hypothetical protein